MYTDLGWLTTITPFPEIKKPSSRIQSKVLTGWRSCTIVLLWYHHLALLYNQGMLGRHLKLPEVVESVCVNFSPQRGLMPSEFSNELPHQVKKHINSGTKSKRKKLHFSAGTNQTHHIYRKSLTDRETVTTIIQGCVLESTHPSLQQCKFSLATYAMAGQTVIKSHNCSTGHNRIHRTRTVNSKVNHRNYMRLQESQGITHAQHAPKRLIPTGPNCLSAVNYLDIHYIRFKKLLC